MFLLLFLICHCSYLLLLRKGKSILKEKFLRTCLKSWKCEVK
ncbi:putative transposase [Wolbachia endosymbiont of Cimex lectularius]|nr:putative transposase [Wolbachia endosymbiont of Cimex lectularius]